MKIIYMGTPEYAVPPLKALVEEGHEVVLCVTQPDKQKGRGKKVMFPPVKEAAVELGIPVLQPVRVKEEEMVEQLRKLNPELIVVAAFGQILSKEILYTHYNATTARALDILCSPDTESLIVPNFFFL